MTKPVSSQSALLNMGLVLQLQNFALIFNELLEVLVSLFLQLVKDPKVLTSYLLQVCVYH